MGDAAAPAAADDVARFQPTPTHGGRRPAPSASSLSPFVSTHAHARWATVNPEHLVEVGYDVSTHAHARWATEKIYSDMVARRVSTHAHARWATWRRVRWLEGRLCFNPRPRTVGDPQLSRCHPLPIVFQPTPTHGGRPRSRRSRSPEGRVSTHAHARWATPGFGPRWPPRSTFQPTPTHGGRPFWRSESLTAAWFQPTPTHGGRQGADALMHARYLFQPTPTHGGRRERWFVGERTNYVSTHAHARWATDPGRHDDPDEGVSTHAHARWATQHFIVAGQITPVSTHAHARWATPPKRR